MVNHTSNKVLIAPALLLIGIALFTMVILTDAGLVLFNVVFGRPVYAVEMTYAFNPYYESGQTLIKVTFNFQLVKPKESIETALSEYAVQVVGQEMQLDVSQPGSFQFNIPVHIYTGQPQSQIGLYDRTFTYTDNNLRQITIYLPNFDPAGQPDQQQLFVEIRGSYTLNSQQYTYDAGGTLKVAM
jgi:hypothetical protein